MIDTATDSPETQHALTHNFRFETFKIRGATHFETDLTIDQSGNWTSTSRVMTRDVRFKPRMSLLVEFFHADGKSIPEIVGAPPEDWAPKELWQNNFDKSEEKTIRCSGHSDYLAENFDTLANASEARLKIRLKKRPGIMDRFR